MKLFSQCIRTLLLSHRLLPRFCILCYKRSTGHWTSPHNSETHSFHEHSCRGSCIPRIGCLGIWHSLQFSKLLLSACNDLNSLCIFPFHTLSSRPMILHKSYPCWGSIHTGRLCSHSRSRIGSWWFRSANLSEWMVASILHMCGLSSSLFGTLGGYCTCTG